MSSTRPASQKITVVLTTDLLAAVEAAAKANYCSRSDYIRTALVQRLNRHNRQRPQASQPQPVKAPSPVEPLTRQEEEKFLKELVEQYS